MDDYIYLYFLLGYSSRTKIYEGSCSRRLQPCWWLTRPIRDKQVRPQWLQLKVWSGIAIDAPLIFLLWRFSLRLSLWRQPGGRCSARPDGQQIWRSLMVINVAGTESPLKGVFLTFLWCFSVTMTSGEFTIHLGLAIPPPPFWIDWFVGFYGISTFVGYLTPNPFLCNNLFYWKQFSLA